MHAVDTATEKKARRLEYFINQIQRQGYIVHHNLIIFCSDHIALKGKERMCNPTEARWIVFYRLIDTSELGDSK